MYLVDDPAYFSDEENRENFEKQYYEIIKGSVEVTISEGLANGIIRLPPRGKANLYAQRLGIGIYTLGAVIALTPDLENGNRYRVYIGFEDSIGKG